MQAEAVLNHSTQPWTQITQDVRIIPPMIFYDESAAAVVVTTIPPHPAITKKTIARAIARNFAKPYITQTIPLSHVVQTLARI
jgi:hypothetical protein